MEKGKRAARRWGLGRWVVVVEIVTEGKRKRGSHMLLWLLTELYFLTPVRLFFFKRDKHLYLISFKIKTTKMKTECANNERNGELVRWEKED